MLQPLQSDSDALNEGVIVYRFENEAITSMLNLNNNKKALVEEISRLADDEDKLSDQTSFCGKKFRGIPTNRLKNLSHPCSQTTATISI